MTAPHADLPLTYRTPPQWTSVALSDPLRLLNDHAHLEKKAAANALELLNRFPEHDLSANPSCAPSPNAELTDRWVATMTAVARDEVEHLAAVLKLIHRRGGRFSRSHRNAYAKALRGLVRQGEGPLELMDRLMVSALIEARSCERFELLAEHCPDAELARLYRGLHASEHGHYLVFLDLARAILDPQPVESRWQWMLEQEAAIIAAQPPGPSMHSGMASNTGA